MNIYLGIGVLLAIVAAIVFGAFGGSKPVQKISMEDLGVSTSKPSSGKAK